VSKRKKRQNGLCPSCSGTGEVKSTRTGKVKGTRSRVTCPNCRVLYMPGRIEVSGTRATEVAAVIERLVVQRATERSPWRSGLFYLMALSGGGALCLATALLAPAWALPVVIAGMLAGLVTLGVLQLRHDGRISETSMVAMTKLSMRAARPASAGRPVQPTQEPGAEV